MDVQPTGRQKRRLYPWARPHRSGGSAGHATQEIPTAATNGVSPFAAPATAAPFASPPSAPTPQAQPVQVQAPQVVPVSEVGPSVPPVPALQLVADHGPRRVGGRAPKSTPRPPLTVTPPARMTTPAEAPETAPMTAPVATAAAAFDAPTEPIYIAPPAPVGSANPVAPPAVGFAQEATFGDERDTAVLAPVQIAEGAVPAAPSAVDVLKREPARPSPTGPLASLEARNISAWFGDRKVLDHVSLLMPAGECTALIGPSGCGKSTFLRILNRMHELIPSASLAGDVLLDGADLYARENRLTDARRQVGMVFQKPNPFPAMSIYDNVVAGLRLTGKRVGQGHKDALVESCLTKAGLWKEVKDRLRQPGGALSGGQQQRLCIARSLAIQPRVLLMDEPCSALDPTSTRRIEQTIRELVDEVTIVIVTHNMQQAARVSDKCAFFLAEAGTPGVIVEHGETEAMFNTPADPRTYDYVNGRFG